MKRETSWSQNGVPPQSQVLPPPGIQMMRNAVRPEVQLAGQRQELLERACDFSRLHQEQAAG
jgi:hypothetical protein